MSVLKAWLFILFVLVMFYLGGFAFAGVYLFVCKLTGKFSILYTDSFNLKKKAKIEFDYDWQSGKVMQF